ncbi:LysR family transcriptional regulator [Dickeya fangzhongdai]|uniref:LysR family transcriptional regulator n=1 Tax=Dickeya fangzhongdai TaxID=1778540 RepID=UPI002B30E95B|nr:LysR family transcriptional regulator [Dickeya fangzhongdai]
MNKLEALRCFCIAAETLQFRETAVRLSVSPQVVSRVISELEEVLGETLFKRNTRSMKLTSFGEQFRVQAHRLLEDSERLFSRGAQHEREMSGVVRITLPRLPDNDAILTALLTDIASYPDLVIDWRVDASKLNLVEEQIDIGLRISVQPDRRYISRRICHMNEVIVASPSLLEKTGYPKDLDDLQRNFPLSGLIDTSTGRIWPWQISEHHYISPAKPRFITLDAYSELGSALGGQTFGHILECMCRQYLQTGELIQIFPELTQSRWQMYLFRPQQTVTSARVKFVFERLEKILKGRYAN